MGRLTKLLIAAIALAVAQTMNAAVFSQNAFAWGSAAFCWAVVGVLAWRRKAQGDSNVRKDR